MSYVQEAHVPVNHRQVVAGRSIVLSARAALALLLTLAFLHGALYALFLPPWGLIDEAQHLHYIQYIAEEQALPVAGNLYLSPEIVDSLFATRRWHTFHWTPPPALDPKQMGLEGYSYEAYQPPLFYLAMTPFYWALPQDTLLKVYGLRLVALLLSLVTVWSLYRTAALLLPHSSHFAFWAGLILVAIPERAIATSRINNDVLLEVLAALFFLFLTRSALAGLTGRRAFLLGLLLGLAAWVKVPGGLLAIPLLLLFWHCRRQPHFWRNAAWALVAAPMGAALATRNLLLYGDLTGFNAFERLHRLAAVDTSWAALLRTLVSLPNHLWLVWWKGSDTGSNALLTIFYLIMGVVLVAAWGRLWLHLWPERNHPLAKSADHLPANRRALAFIYLVTVLLYAGAVMSSYYGGMVPVVQGRLLLPAIVPFVLLLVWGVWLLAWRARILAAVVVLLWAMGLFALFGNLVPYYYYWSDVVDGTLIASSTSLRQALQVTWHNSLLDKPAFFAPLLVVLPVGYGVALLYTFVIAVRAMTPPPYRLAQGKYPSVVVPNPSEPKSP